MKRKQLHLSWSAEHLKNQMTDEYRRVLESNVPKEIRDRLVPSDREDFPWFDPQTGGWYTKHAKDEDNNG